ncbi:MAG: hypothetical protein Q9215_002257 [Flavoplaca cf. flavocitrina]
MSEQRRSSRRLSARLGDKEDAPSVNGLAHGQEKAKGGQTPGNSTRQPKASVNGATSEPKGKRKLADYDEDFDGFKFTRTRAKKAKAEPAPQIQPIEEDNHEDTSKAAPVKRSRKRTSGSPKSTVTGKADKPEPRRRSPRNSGDKEDLAAEGEPPIPTLEVKKKRRPKDDGSQETRKSSRKHDQAVSTQPQDPTATAEPPRLQPLDKPLEPIKVSLPFADTPIIRRNQEMRRGVENGSRRSSLGQRGRRASSLIDSGKSDVALPHEEVDSTEFYKHIESSLTEPRRMKQLLTWCGTRALGEKPSSTQKDFHARQAGGSSSSVQEQKSLELMIEQRAKSNNYCSKTSRRNQKCRIGSTGYNDFVFIADISSRLPQKETTPPPQQPKPNPKNISNEKRIQELEQELAKLQNERQTWETLLRPPASNALALSPLSTTPDPNTISSELLDDPSQVSALSSLLRPLENPQDASSTPTEPSIPYADLQSSTLTRLLNITGNNNLEFTIDTFANNIHTLNSYQQATDRVAGEVLAISAEALEEREKEGRRRDADGGEVEEVGVRDVLRGLNQWRLDHEQDIECPAFNWRYAVPSTISESYYRQRKQRSPWAKPVIQHTLSGRVMAEVVGMNGGSLGSTDRTNLDDVKAHEKEEGICIHPALTWENGILQGHCLEIGYQCYVLYVASLIGNSQYDEKKRMNGFDTGVGGFLAGALKVRARDRRMN